MMQTINYAPVAYIGVGRNILRTYKTKQSNNVYMENEQEFEFFIQNPTKNSYLVKVKFNNKLISNSGLVIKPGQTIWLDCNWDDNRKFVFNTYSVDNNQMSKAAIADNGIVSIEFYKEKGLPIPVINLSLPRYPWGQHNIYGHGFGFISSSGPDVFRGSTNSNLKCCSATASLDSLDMAPMEDNSIVETGRIEKGSESDQIFTTVDMDFNSLIDHSYDYKILPVSQRPVEKRDLGIKCGGCNKKVKSKDKFCSSCGTNLNA